MKQDWKNIKENINQAREPLSEDAWNRFEAQLDQSNGRRRWLLPAFSIVVLLLLFAGWVLFSPDFINRDKAPVVPPQSILQDPSPDTDADVRESKNLENAPSGKRNTEKEKEQENPASGPALNARNSHNKPENPANIISGKKEAMPEKNGPETAIAGEAVPVYLSVKQPGLPEDEAISLSLLTDHEKELQSGVKEAVSRFELRVFAGLTYNLPSYTRHPVAAQTHKDYSSVTENGIQAGIGADAGVEVQYRIFRNFKLSSGLSYREVITRNNYDYEVNEIPVIDSATGNIITYIPANQPVRQEQKGENRYTFLNIPVSLYYEIPLSEKWIFTGEAIHNFSFLLGQSGWQVDPQSLEIEKTDDNIFQKTTHSYQLRLGLRYRVQDNFYLALEPAYRSYYNDIFRQGPLSWKPRDFSLSIAAIVKFNN